MTWTLEAQFAWLAALIDGEGSVMLVNHRCHTSKSSMRARVCVYNTDRRLVDAIIEKFGVGRVYTHTRGTAKPTHTKLAYEWRLSSNEISTLLPLIIPYLIIKREQSRLLLEYLEIARQNACVAGKSRVYVSGKEEIYLKIRELNKKGVAA